MLLINDSRVGSTGSPITPQICTGDRLCRSLHEILRASLRGLVAEDSTIYILPVVTGSVSKLLCPCEPGGLSEVPLAEPTLWQCRV